MTKIKVSQVAAPVLPALNVYKVVVETLDTEWQESFGSKIEVEAFIRGVKAGAAIGGIFGIVEDIQAKL